MNDLPVDRMWLNADETRLLTDVEGSYTYFADGDVLLAKITPCFENGKLGIARKLKNGVGFGSSEFFVLRPSERLLAEYLYYFLSRADYRERGASVMTGAVGHRRVPKEFVEGTLLPLPPLAEQKRIVAILDEAFEGIAKATANAERNLANARELLAVIRQERFMALRDLAPTSTLGEICKFENGDRGANYPGKQHRVSEGVPFINAGHLSEAGIDFSEMDYISPERFSLLGNGKIRPNDVLFCLRGSLGKFACVNELDKGAIASSLVILRPSERLNLAYLLEYLAGPICAAMIAKYKGGAAQPNLGAKDLKKFEIPLPAHDIQRSTAEELSSFAAQTRDVETAYRAKIAGCMELRQSLLRKAFSGQLTGKEAVAA
jgi:type I restriction enzyme S subunit